MQVKVVKKKMTSKVIEQIIQIDNQFYAGYNYPIEWYYKRYNGQNYIYTLNVGSKIVGYFLFLNITKQLFKDVLNLKYEDDYYFPSRSVNVHSNYYYVPSVLICDKYRKYGYPLLRKLWHEAEQKDNLIAITISREGHKMAATMMRMAGYANKDKDIRVYVKTSEKL